MLTGAFKQRIAHLDRFFKMPVMREPLARLIANLRLGSMTKPHLIGLTASNHEEGVTTLAIYLGVEIVKTFSIPVLVVEANFRKPRLASYCKIPRSPGLLDVLTGEGLKMDVKVHRSSLKNLFLLPAGGDHPHPLGLFSSTRYEEFLDSARKRYPVIIVDAPPILPYAEGPSTLKPLDLNAFVVAADATREEDVHRAVHNLEELGVTLTGSVLNRKR